MITTRASFAEMIVETFDAKTIMSYYQVTPEELLNGAWNMNLEYGYTMLKNEQDWALGLL